MVVESAGSSGRGAEDSPFVIAQGILRTLGQQVPAFNQYNITDTLYRIKTYLMANTRDTFRDPTRNLRGGRMVDEMALKVDSPPTKLADPTATAMLVTNNAFWLTTLTGSATQNLDNPGEPYEIHARDGGPIFIRAKKAKGGMGEVKLLENRDELSMEHDLASTFSRLNNPIGPKPRDMTPRLNEKYGGYFVNYVKAHPGRPPDKKLRQAYMKVVAGDAIDFGSDTAKAVQTWLQENTELFKKKYTGRILYRLGGGPVPTIVRE